MIPESIMFGKILRSGSISVSGWCWLGVVLFFVVLLLPIRDARSKGGWKINTSRLKNYERLLPGRRLVLAYVKYLKERM